MRCWKCNWKSNRKIVFIRNHKFLYFWLTTASQSEGRRHVQMLSDNKVKRCFKYFKFEILKYRYQSLLKNQSIIFTIYRKEDDFVLIKYFFFCFFCFYAYQVLMTKRKLIFLILVRNKILLRFYLLKTFINWVR